MSYYGEWKMFKRELAEELAKPKPDEKKNSKKLRGKKKTC